MVLSNDDKKCERKMSELFWYKYIPKYSCLIKKVVPSSFSNQLVDQKLLVIYFDYCKKSELVNSMLAKGNLSLSY